MACIEALIACGFKGGDKAKGGEGAEQRKVMPPSESGFQSFNESESSVIVGSGAIMAASGESSMMKKR